MPGVRTTEVALGRLIEYAANGTRYSPVDELRALYGTGCRTRGVEPDQGIE